jgi:acyl carrier protein
MESTLTSLREFVLKQFPAARKFELGEDDSLLERGIIDSMGVLEIVNYIETEFDVLFSDDELLSDHFRSIRAMAEFIHQKQNAGAAWTT